MMNRVKQIARITMRMAVTEAAGYFPLATPIVARRQRVRLLRAKAYMRERGIAAVEIGSKFEYKSGADLHATIGSRP